MNLEPILHLVESNGLGVRGTSLFLNHIPEMATEAVVLMNMLSGTPINYELPGYFRTGFQGIVRSKSYEVGQPKADALGALLTIYERRVGNMNVKFIRPKTQPIVYPRTVASLLEFSINFEAVFSV